MIDKNKVINRVAKALASQFETYSWENMLDDCEFTKEEKEWALEHTSYKLNIF